jgi:RND family efflux transporter MFP subunit
MKKIYTLFLLVLAFNSCGEKKSASIEALVSEGTLEELIAKKKELTANLDAKSVDLKKIDDAIADKDTLQKLPLITTITTKEEVFKHYLEIQGNVTTKQNILIYPEIPGILKAIFVKEGQQVSKGELLATIDDGGLSNQLAQLEVTTELNKTTYERQKRLWEQKIGSEIQFLQTKANYESQKNALKQLKSQLSKASIRAPFSGVIDDVMKEAGTVIAPGQGSEVFRIMNLNNMHVEAEVPERYLTTIAKGKEVSIEFPVLTKKVKSSIRQVGNYIKPNNRSFKIEVPVANKNGTIKPNLTAKLLINDYTDPKAILIPQSIISENSKGEEFIYIVKNKNSNQEAIAQKLIIKTGKTQGDLIEVIENLAVGSEIIKEGARSVNNGQKVKVIEE